MTWRYLYRQKNNAFRNQNEWRPITHAREERDRAQSLTQITVEDPPVYFKTEAIISVKEIEKMPSRFKSVGNNMSFVVY